LPDFHVAHVNVALPREPIMSELLAGFVALMEPVNAAADQAEGFVWRCQLVEEPGFKEVPGLADDRLLVNMSVWESVEALREFTFTARDHRAAMQQRRTWFEPLPPPYTALWWVPAGHVPDVAEAGARLEHLRAHGPTPLAFTFRHVFDPPPAATALAAPGRATDS